LGIAVFKKTLLIIQPPVVYTTIVPRGAALFFNGAEIFITQRMKAISVADHISRQRSKIKKLPSPLILLYDF